ncbi:MAG TPA: hypothetical protein VGW75_13725 [Solirubrobacteraceae bacterium]|nr:hypothetical protein [Solirubrobacteraceae bacterium]
MTHPLSARLVLLAAAAALAASLVFALIVAESRDYDGRPGTGSARAAEVRGASGPPEVRGAAIRALDAASAGGLRVVRTAAR